MLPATRSSPYRLYEFLPGALAWGTILLLLIGSRFAPQAVGIFVVLFGVYWLLKSIYLSIHMRAAFKKMKANLKVNWLKELELMTHDKMTYDQRNSHQSSVISHWSRVRHLVLFPMYKEPYEVVRESFASLARAEYPKEHFLVVLATEARAGKEAERVVEKIRQEFGNSFGGFLITTHPEGLPGEIPGKGANIAWATQRAKEELIDPLIRRENKNEYEHNSHSHPLSSRSHPTNTFSYENVLVSAFDIDTQAPPQYFARLTHAYLTTPDPLHAIYQPIPLFTNNIYEAPLLARIVTFSATFWQMMQQARPERLTTFSSQSVPLKVLNDVGFWHRDVVSEDSRIFWQAFLHYHGNFRVEPLAFPVRMDANVAPTFWGTLKNIYRQQRRWGWGVENVPYLLHGFKKDHLIPKEKKRYWAFLTLEGFHSWSTNAFILFFLGWMPSLIGGEEFRSSLFSYNIGGVTRVIMIMAMIGVITAAEIALALLPPRPSWFRRRHAFVYILEWLLLPITLIFFGALPGLEAQTRLMLGGKWRLGFWITPKTRKGFKKIGKGVGETGVSP
ncbi:MAG: glycosyltransferase family 2 protein [Candidatus Liptonbacteria bacterium]|nr:glycosyltransferase family 2 protein [Candidatus Liptonbacteria bacterium]